MMRAIQILLAAMAVSASAAVMEKPAVDCVKATQPTWKETIGNDEATFAWNPDSVTITTQDSDTVTFEISQLWVADGTPMFSVHYRSTNGQEICDEVQDAEQALVTNGFKKSYTAQCIGDVAEVSIYMYVGDNDINVAECESCVAPSVDYCGHYITIPCVDVPECTSAPTSAPTDPVDAVIVPRDDCYAPVVEMAEQAGDTEHFEYENPINVIEMGLDSVTVEVTQVFSEEGVAMLAVSYEEVDFGSKCDMQQPVSFETSTTITAQCINGYAEMAVFLYTGEMEDFDVTKCDACKLTDENEYVAYYYVVPCIPTCKPEIPDCFTGPLTVLADIGNDYNQHHCIYGDMPVKLSETYAGPDAVAFYLQDTWPGSTGSVSISYTNQKEGTTVCEAYSPAMIEAKKELTASCNDDDTATIVVTLNDSEITHNAYQIDANTCTVFTEGGTCSYEVVLPCDSMMMCGAETTETPTESPTTLSPTTGFPTLPPTLWPTANPSDGPTGTPTKEPTGSPTGTPTKEPTSSPTGTPTKEPTGSPTGTPTKEPTGGPTGTPTKEPTSSPTGTPTKEPTSSPTGTPTKEPTGSPTGTPTKEPTTTPTASPTLSMAPTDCMEFKEPQVVNTMCFNGNEAVTPILMPSGTVAISALIGNTVNVLINSPFDKEAQAIAIKHDDFSLESSCDVHSSISSAIEFNAACVHDMASTTIIVYYDDGFSASTCDACDTNKEDGYDGMYCAYNIEMSCESTSVACGEPSASPSGSFYPSLAPSESPTKSAAPTSSPTDSPSDGPTSNPTSNPTASPTSTPTSAPTGSPSSGPSESPTSAPTGSPSSGPTVKPTSAPTGSPSFVPTATPTAGPTTNPTVSMEPSNCVGFKDPFIDSKCMTTSGNDMATQPLTAADITINEVADGTVSISISETWTNNALDQIGLVYRIDGDGTCVTYGNVTAGETVDIMATCISGSAGLTVVAHLSNEFTPTECDACNAEDLASLGGSDVFCSYHIEIPCETMDVPCGEPSASPSGSFYPSLAPSESPTVSMSPTASPTTSPSTSPSSSPSDSPTASPTTSPSTSPSSSLAPSSSPSCPRDPAELISSEGDTDYDHMPITITFQNDSHVEFEVENTFGENITIFTERHSGDFGETECLQEENFGTDDPLAFTATCMHNVKISIVNLWVMECVTGDPVYLQSGDNAEIPECCHAPQDCKVVQYTFKLPCKERACPESETSQRRLADAHSLISEKKAEVASTAEFEELTGHADPSDVDDHFCVIEDYPCGTSLDKVHVCHYSARDGYKTFCVPEADSDALRFYPKDYCGPCVGGYSNA